ncbi:putative reverse transcriptase zinc-binding domain-containing protein [Helianthus annuus]|nr:putative reverse transcriptase zinc-binding domain-containing protein [Helianthus annuus]
MSVISTTKVGGIKLLHNFKGVAGNGDSIRFWLDPWACNEPLKDRFPALFRLESDKCCLIASRFDSSLPAFYGKWGWSRNPASEDERREWNAFIGLLDSVNLPGTGDRWEWIGGNDKVFSVRAVKGFLKSATDFSNNFVLKWSKWVPKKVNILVWRAQMGRIATLDALSKRNCFNGDERCILCNDGLESADHLFRSCIVASEVWFLISKWCNISPISAFSLKDLLEVHEFSGLGAKAKIILKGIIMVGWWCIWLARNNRRFSNKLRSAASIVHDIKSLGFLWYRNRSKCRDITWEDWMSFSVL